MQKVVNNGRISASPCNLDEVIANFPDISQMQLSIEQFINNGGVDSFEVLVSGAQTSPPAYLFASFTNPQTRDVDADPLIGVEINDPGASETVNAFLDSSEVPGFADIPDGEFWPLGIERTGDVRAIAFKEVAGGGGDPGPDSDELVGVSSGDTTPGYLTDKLADSAETKTTADILVAFQKNNSGGNETLTAFVDASTVTGYSGSGVYVMCWVDGVAMAVAVGSISTPDEMVKAHSSDPAPGYLYDKIQDTGTYSSDDHQLVKAAIEGNKVRLFANKGGSGGGCTCIIDEDIAAATRTGLGDGFTPTVKYFKYLTKVDAEYVLAVDEEEEPLTRAFEWHDVNDGFDRATALSKYHGLCTLTDDGVYVIHTIVPCDPYNPEDEEE